MPRKQEPIARAISTDDVDPRHRWDRPLQAPGHMQVDFEERVDFRRLHAYGQTILMVTHSDEVAAGADRIVGMRDGKVDEETSTTAAAPVPAG